MRQPGPTLIEFTWATLSVGSFFVFLPLGNFKKEKKNDLNPNPKVLNQKLQDQNLPYLCV